MAKFESYKQNVALIKLLHVDDAPAGFAEHARGAPNGEAAGAEGGP